MRPLPETRPSPHPAPAQAEGAETIAPRVVLPLLRARNQPILLSPNTTAGPVHHPVLSMVRAMVQTPVKPMVHLHGAMAIVDLAHRELILAAVRVAPIRET